MKILLTGSVGYIGSALAQKLQNQNLVLVDNYSAKYDNRPLIKKIGAFEVLNLDLKSSQVCKEVTQGIDVVIHLAAIPGISRCESADTYGDNVLATTNLGMWAELNGVKKFIYASTSAVYGESQSENITESHRIAPRCRYGNQKYGCEVILQSLKLPVVILRKSNCYGEALFHKNVAVDIFIEKVLEGEPIIIDGSGQQRRDYIHIDDTTDAYSQAIYWDSGVYNIGGNDNLSINELADLVIKVSNKDVKKIYHEGNAGRLLKKFRYNCDKAKALGFKPRRKIEDEIKQRISNHSHQA